MNDNRSRWASRFIGMTFVLGGVLWVIIAILLLGNLLAGLEPPNYALGPASSRIIAGGGAGTWFVMGMLAFMILGIVGVALSALFYQYVEVSLGSALAGWRNTAAWVHLLLGGLGASATALLMAYGGYLAGVASLPTNAGGGGHANDVAYIHANILGPLAIPIAALMGVALVGYLVGGVGLATAWMASRKR